jgi:Uma2 family endonuclease
MEGSMGDPAMDLERRFQYKDYVEWPEDERWELIHGEPQGMSAPTTAHQDWAGEIFHQLKTQLKGKPCKPYIAPVDLLPFLKPGDALNSSDTVVQPDVFVIGNPDQNRGKVVVGAPAFVFEVQLETTSWRDQTQKLKLYEEVGVAEYLMFNPENRTLWASRLGPDGRYGQPQVWVGAVVVDLVSLPGVKLDFTTVP